MQELSPVGLSGDGKRLVLLSASGEEYSVAVDHRLRAALRGDNARLGQLEMKMESALRPRDIQARIRAGESPDQVAAAAQTTVDAIMGFATPVLAERAHVAQVAQKSSVRRRSAESSSSARTLGEAAAANLHDLGVAEDEVSWDAWRRDDGRWTLVAEFGDHHAEFTYDQPGRYVTADNDHARLLTGEVRRAAPEGPSGRRLSAVPDQDELPLGDDAIELVRERLPEVPEAAVPATGSAGATEETVELPPAGQAAGPVDEPAAGEQGGHPEHPAAREPTTDPTTEPATEPATGPAAETGGETTEEPSGRPRRKGRASVPSWDEIMFGGGGAE
ncbi:MAG TPA: septation protein SepH [Marmoricola sp.]|nr:septation protein SepH [Marmoricola sp.]